MLWFFYIATPTWKKNRHDEFSYTNTQSSDRYIHRKTQHLSLCISVVTTTTVSKTFGIAWGVWMTLYSFKNQIVFHVYGWINVDEWIQISFNVISWRNRCSNIEYVFVKTFLLIRMGTSSLFSSQNDRFLLSKIFSCIHFSWFYGITKKVDFLHMNSKYFDYINFDWRW